MKSLAVLTIFAICAIELSQQADDPPKPAYACPDANHLGDHCTCYPSVFYVVCNELTKESIKNFAPTKPVNVKTLIIKNSDKLPEILEHFDGLNTFKAESLVVVQSKPLVTPIQALINILQFVTKSVQITGNDKMVLEMGELPKSLQSLSIENVKELKNLKLDSYEQLTSLELKNVQLESSQETLIFADSSLKRLVITGDATLKQVISFAPKTACAPTDPAIQIILCANGELTSFDFSQLFAGKAKDCKYNVDLSNNVKMNPSLLASQVKGLKDVKPESLYLVMRDTKQTCDQCVTQFYKTRESYIHSVKCDKEKKFLDQLTAEEAGKLAPCPP